MDYEKKIINRIIFLLLYGAAGAAIAACGYTGIGGNEVTFCMGLGLCGGGLINAFRNIRLLKNKELLMKRKTAERDERVLFIYERARSLAFVIMVFVLLGVMVFCSLTGRTEQGVLAAYAICAQLIIYYFCSLYLRKKY